MIRTRFKKYYHYVYITINLINGKMYVGDHSTKNLNDHYRGSGKRLWSSFKKYGRENFLRRILKFYPTRLEAHLAEIEYIIKYDTLNPNGYNISPTGGVHCNGGITAEETKQKLSILHKAWLKTPKGIKQREWFSINNPSKRPDIKQRASERLSLKNNPPWHTPEARAKGRKLHKAYFQTFEGIKNTQVWSKEINKKWKIWSKTPEGIAKKERDRARMSGENNPNKNPEVIIKREKTKARNKAQRKIEWEAEWDARVLAEHQVNKLVS